MNQLIQLLVMVVIFAIIAYGHTVSSRDSAKLKCL